MKYIETNWTAELIASYVNSPYWRGFEGDECWKCHAIVNVPADGSGWLCKCGHYSCQEFHGCRPLHETPDCGPTPYTIQYGQRIAYKSNPRYHEIPTPTSRRDLWMWVDSMLYTVADANFGDGIFCFDKNVEGLIKLHIKRYRPDAALFCFRFPESMEFVLEEIDA